MKKSLLRKFICIVLSLFFCASSVCTCKAVEVYSITDNPHVLFISSYSYDWESVPKQLDGITDTLNGYAQIEYVFMDTKRLEYDDVKENICRDIETRIKAEPFDYVIVGDDAALQFVLDYRDRLFSGIPIVFEGINNVDNAYTAAQDPLMTGIVEVFPLAETIELASKINPDAKHVVGISDDTLSGQGSTKQFNSCISQFPDLDFSILDCSEMTADELGNTLETYSSDTILVFLMMTSDKDGNHYSMTEAAEFISAHASVPVYKADELGIGQGMLGGVVVSYYDMAAKAASIVLRLFKGEDISTIPAETVQPSGKFDADVMEKFGIRKSDITDAYSGDVTFINEKVSFFSAHSTVIIPLGMVILLLIILAFISFSSIQSKKKLLKEMDEKDRMLNTILGNIPGGIAEYRVHHGKELTVDTVYFSEGVATLTGHTMEEYWEQIRSGSFMHAVDEKDLPSVIEAFKKYMPLKKPFNINFHLKHKDGTMIYVSMAAVWGNDEDSETSIYYGIYMNISEQERVQQAEREAMAAKASNTAKSTFLSRMSHDIRTPLNAVLGFTELAREEKNPPETDDYLDKIKVSGRYLLELINDVLDMSKIDSGKMELHEENTNELRSLTLTAEIFRDQASKKGIRLITDFPSEDFWVIQDSLRMSQIYSNLLSNAIKFSESGTEIHWIVRNSPNPDGTIHCFIEVRDQGCGMSEEFLSRIYMPFEQGHMDYASQITGTGLGLSIVKSLVSLMKGTIHVESHLNEGSVFTIEMDRKPGHPEKEKVTVKSSADSLRGRHIMIVEDNATNALIGQRLLENKGCRIDCAGNGKEGLDLFAKSSANEYDAILMDIRMPVMDGLSAAEAIRKLNRPDAKTVPILAMSANSFEEDVQASLNAGMNAHLPKPIEPEILYQTLEQEIEKAEKKN